MSFEASGQKVFRNTSLWDADQSDGEKTNRAAGGEAAEKGYKEKRDSK